MPLGFSYVKFDSGAYNPGELQVDGTKAPGYWNVTANFSLTKDSVPYATFGGYLLKVGATIKKPVTIGRVLYNCEITLKNIDSKGQGSYWDTASFQIVSELPDRAENVFYPHGAYSLINKNFFFFSY